MDARTIDIQRGIRSKIQQFFARFCKKRVNIERVTQAKACATRSEPPKPATLRVAGFAARVVALGCGFSCARVAL